MRLRRNISFTKKAWEALKRLKAQTDDGNGSRVICSLIMAAAKKNG